MVGPNPRVPVGDLPFFAGMEIIFIISHLFTLYCVLVLMGLATTTLVCPIPVDTMGPVRNWSTSDLLGIGSRSCLRITSISWLSSTRGGPVIKVGS